MKTIFLSLCVASQAWAFTCSSPVTLFEESRFYENDFHATMDDQGTAGLIWSEQSSPDRVRTVKMVASTLGKHLPPVVVSDVEEQSMFSTTDEEEWDRSIATRMDSQGNQFSFYNKEISFLAYKLIVTENSPFHTEKKHKLGRAPVHLSQGSNFALGLNESGKHFVFWEKAEKGGFHTIERVFTGSWREEDGSWSHPERVVFSDPRFKETDDIQIATDSNGNVGIVGTVLSQGHKKGQAIWALTRSSDGQWSGPEIITDYSCGLVGLQIQEHQGNFLIVWGDVYEGTIYSAHKTVNQPWSSPTILAGTGDHPQLRNFGFRLTTEQPGRFIILWQFLDDQNFTPYFYSDPIYGCIFTFANGWSFSHRLSPKKAKGEFYTLKDFAVNKQGEGVVIWAKTFASDIDEDDDDYEEGDDNALVQARLFKFD